MGLVALGQRAYAKPNLLLVDRDHRGFMLLRIRVGHERMVGSLHRIVQQLPVCAVETTIAQDVDRKLRVLLTPEGMLSHPLRNLPPASCHSGRNLKRVAPAPIARNSFWPCSPIGFGSSITRQRAGSKTKGT